MLGYFRYVPHGVRFYRLRCWVRRTFGLYLSRREIVADIRRRMSDEKLTRWSVMEEDRVLDLQNTIGAKIRRAYGMYEPGNRFVELDPQPDSDGGITDQYFPDNVSSWIINRLRMEAREYVHGS